MGTNMFRIWQFGAQPAAVWLQPAEAPMAHDGRIMGTDGNLLKCDERWENHPSLAERWKPHNCMCILYGWRTSTQKARQIPTTESRYFVYKLPAGTCAFVSEKFADRAKGAMRRDERTQRAWD